AKRNQTADLSGRVALITGGRVKIGYETALKLLRAGAFVLATTRFPRDAALRYAREHDFATWSDRLHVYGIDLRHLASVERSADHLCASYTRLDILINNAAQTIRRPPAFYKHLLEGELHGLASLPGEVRRLIAGPRRPDGDGLPLSAEVADIRVPGLPHAAALSQLPLLAGDGCHDPALFPPGLYDADGPQVDRRPQP